MWTSIPSAHFPYKHGLPATPSACGGLRDHGAAAAAAAAGLAAASAAASRGKRCGESVQSSPMPVHQTQVGSSRLRHYLRMPPLLRTSESQVSPPHRPTKTSEATLGKSILFRNRGRKRSDRAEDTGHRSVWPLQLGSVYSLLSRIAFTALQKQKPCALSFKGN